jgi:F-type H+-transporting ATPase subunit b
MNQLIISAATEGAAPSPLAPNWWEIGVVLAGFAVLLYIVRQYVVPMFEKTFAERAEAIEGGIAKAEKAQAEASAALEEYKQQLSDARAEANRIREEARSEGAQILADLKDKAAEESARITDQARAAIDAERQAAAVALRQDVGALAAELAGRIVGEALTDDERAKRVVDRFLADLENQSAGAAK